MRARYRIHDNRGKTIDRYTLLIPSDEPGMVDMWAFNEQPYHPQGIGMYAGSYPRPRSYSHLGRSVTLSALPEQAQRFVREILAEYGVKANPGTTMSGYNSEPLMSDLDWAIGAMSTHLLASGTQATWAPRLNRKNFNIAKKILRKHAKSDSRAARLLIEAERANPVTGQANPKAMSRTNPSMAFGKQIAVEYAKGNLLEGIWNLGQTSEGTLFPSRARVFSSSVHADVANREAFPTMGFRLFYGLHPDGNVIEFIKKGRIGQKDMAKIRELGVRTLWTATFTAKTWLINGQEKLTKYHADLSSVETTREAIRWGKALGRF